jgi:hypothetical protein
MDKMFDNIILIAVFYPDPFPKGRKDLFNLEYLYVSKFG